MARLAEASEPRRIGHGTLNPGMKVRFLPPQPTNEGEEGAQGQQAGVQVHFRRGAKCPAPAGGGYKLEKDRVLIKFMLTKEEIIGELKRVTKENGGKTPGENFLYENSEIKRYDRMRYWPNYGELVRKAGLKPNKFDNTKYSGEELCKLFIKTIRENKSWPTRGILDVKHNNNLEFPASVTFYKKFGLSRGIAEAVIKFVENKKGYNDVVNICNKILEKSGNEESLDVKNGFVYLGKQHGNYKIGKTRDLNRRREDITLQGAESFALVHYIETDDMEGVEKYWHTRFEPKRMRGEWFSLSINDVKAFKRWKKII